MNEKELASQRISEKGNILDRGASKVTDPDVKRTWSMQGSTRRKKSRASICKLWYVSWTLFLIRSN